MATTLGSAIDAILSTFRVQWLADTPAIVGAAAPVIVDEATEQDLKPHPRDTSKPWARIVVRHDDNSRKVTLQNASGMARYRRSGMAWVQVFVPATDGSQWTVCQNLAEVARKAFEGKRAAGDTVLFTRVAVKEMSKDGVFFRYDIKASFYWDAVK